MSRLHTIPVTLNNGTVVWVRKLSNRELDKYADECLKRRGNESGRDKNPSVIVPGISLMNDMPQAEWLLTRATGKPAEWVNALTFSDAWALMEGLMSFYLKEYGQQILAKQELQNRRLNNG